MEIDRIRKVEKWAGLLADVRRPFEAQIDNIIEFVQHSRRKIKDQSNTRGGKTGIKVYDGTAVSALNLLTDGLCGHTASPSFRWFQYTLPGKWNFPRTSPMRRWSGKRMDEYTEVKEWLRDAEDVAYYAFNRSNFYDQHPQLIRDGASVGTVTMTIEEDIPRSAIVFSVPHFRECYIAENNHGRVDTLFRRFKLTLEQMVEQFGLGTMEKAVNNFKERYSRNPYDEMEVLRILYPRKHLDPYRVDSKNYPFASEWYVKGAGIVPGMELILESGFEITPFITWRWRKNADEWYGRSPSWDAYVDIMKANQQGRSNLLAGHKMVEGPMIAPDDLRDRVMNGPNGWTFVDRDLPPEMWPRPLNEKIQLPYAVDMQERSDKIIREHFHVDFFLMLYQAAFNKVDITATQVVGMQAEQAAILGSRIGSLPSEAYNPIHDSVFYIENRAGRMPQPPEILLDYLEDIGESESKIEIEYMGPLAQAQKRLHKHQSMNAGIDFLARVGTVNPDAIDRVDLDQTVIEGLDSVNWPSNCLRSDDAVAQIREKRAMVQAQAAMAEQAEKIGKTVRHLGKGAEPNSMMDEMMQGLGRNFGA